MKTPYTAENHEIMLAALTQIVKLHGSEELARHEAAKMANAAREALDKVNGANQNEFNEDSGT